MVQNLVMRGVKSQKRKPGGEPGHPGKTHKGFGRVDRSSKKQKAFLRLDSERLFVI